MSTSDGYKHGWVFADLLPGGVTKSQWAKRVLRSGDYTGDLFDAAYNDYACVKTSQSRDEYASDHVRGQQDRAEEILGD